MTGGFQLPSHRARHLSEPLQTSHRRIAPLEVLSQESATASNQRLIATSTNRFSLFSVVFQCITRTIPPQVRANLQHPAATIKYPPPHTCVRSDPVIASIPTRSGTIPYHDWLLPCPLQSRPFSPSPSLSASVLILQHTPPTFLSRFSY